MKKYIIYAIIFISFNSCSAQNKVLQKAVKISKQELQEADKYREQGLVFMEHKEYKKALVCYEKVIKIEPIALNYFSIAQANYFSGNYKNTIEACNKGLKLDPNETLLYLFKGMANIKLNKLDLACEDLNKSNGLGDDLIRKFYKSK